ncbi:uncharacterized protein K452DRAFT_308311 [Aplosporella prunicola CBS 121167]|uniref:Uncharacterized protein n=1 Tax=Aplosporella prunicola CBS 121167 TaxID=1176127 RepID=A0A6A6BJC4_9PEZI|nr:uncharacterized protein K452DRAFT_308311 [Aplosporella prunicola CBS 121167]KAF2142671.1 hypothetical protein K452DRAFT_308311 [Aplosporella prunicola CBS 121167]
MPLRWLARLRDWFELVLEDLHDWFEDLRNGDNLYELLLFTIYGLWLSVSLLIFGGVTAVHDVFGLARRVLDNCVPIYLLPPGITPYPVVFTTIQFIAAVLEIQDPFTLVCGLFVLVGLAAQAHAVLARTGNGDDGQVQRVVFHG